MKRIKLFANCNPLRPNTFICVEDSDSFACSVDSYEKLFLPSSIIRLKDLGFNFYVVKSVEERIDNFDLYETK